MDKAMFKIDFIVFIDGLFIEFSENFYIKIGEERNYNTEILKDLPEIILADGKHYYEKGNYLKATKREFSYLQLVDRNEPEQIRCMDLFNSQIGLLNKLRADLDTVVLMLEQKFKACPMKQVKQALQCIKQYMMTVGDIQFDGPDISTEIDACFKMKKKDEIKKHVIPMSEYLMSVVNSVAKEFLDKNPSIKVLLEKPAKVKKEKVEKIKKVKKTKN